MPAFSPALIAIMRAVLEEAMTKVPPLQATTLTKAYVAEFILKKAAEGLTSYEALMAAATNRLPIILSNLLSHQTHLEQQSFNVPTSLGPDLEVGQS